MLKHTLLALIFALPALAQNCPTLPGTITLKSNSKLPDPFTFFDGTKVTTKAQFTCRQEEISQLFQRYELGTLPPPPSGLTASFSGSSLSITATEGGKSISFSASISGASGGTAPYPAIIAIGGSSIPRPAGVAQITFNEGDMAAQANTGSRGQGKFYQLYGNGHSASATLAWAWGVGRVIDALEKTTGHNIDTKRLAVTGCSRNGKGAIIVGAFEKRIALTIPQESGSGGSACWRISDATKKEGKNVQTASQIVTENVWFSKLFEPYVNRVNDLPFDHHLLSALIAPRALYVIENTSMEWLGARSTWGCQKTAKKIWQALGVPDKMGVSQVGHGDHCGFPSAQQGGELTAFFDKFLKGTGNGNTNIQRTDGANENGFSDATWVDWAVPTLA